MSIFRARKKLKKPNFREEVKLYKKGYKFVAGVDEAGRGPVAGKITAAAVIFPAKIKNLRLRRISRRLKKLKIKNILADIDDSKKLSPAKREELYKILTSNKKIKWAVASVSEGVIDRIGIYKAVQLAMSRAIKKLKPQPDFVIFDGRDFINRKFHKVKNSIFLTIVKKIEITRDDKKYSDNKYKTKFIIKADEKVMSCAAASIIAKVTRDRAMVRLHKKYPQYCFDRHKGYGTKLHMKMLKKHGSCNIHRKSFKPVKKST